MHSRSLMQGLGFGWGEFWASEALLGVLTVNANRVALVKVGQGKEGIGGQIRLSLPPSPLSQGYGMCMGRKCAALQRAVSDSYCA